MKKNIYGMIATFLALAAAWPLGGMGQTLQPLGADRLELKGPLSTAQAVETGLRENLMARAARSDIKAAAAETRVARSQTRLQVSANTYLSIGDTNNILYTAGNVMPQNYLSVPSHGFADQNLTLMVPLYTNGRLENSVRAASQREQAIASDAGGVQADIALRIKEAYYRVLLAAETIQTAQARVDASAALVKNMQALFTAGKGLEASVRRVEAEQADAQRALITARNACVKGMLDLKAAMGIRLDSDITLSDAFTYLPLTGDLSAQMTDAAKMRPELQAARVRAMYTNPDRLRQGIGRRILGLCESAARVAGFSRAEMMATLSGVPLYRACGYVPLERIETPPVEGVTVPLVRMGKALI